MGAQRCLYLAPQTFTVTEDGFSAVTDVSTITEEQAQRVARQCPYSAIIVELHQASGTASE